MIKLPTKVRYGLRAMVDLASQEKKEPVYLNSIASNQNISRNYLDALFAQLRSSGLIRSVRGSSGGYCLNKDPEEIKAIEIVNALDGKPLLLDCLEHEGVCDRVTTCPARELWKKVRVAIEAALSDMTLKDLVNLMNEKKMQQVMMYYI